MSRGLSFAQSRLVSISCTRIDSNHCTNWRLESKILRRMTGRVRPSPSIRIHYPLPPSIFPPSIFPPSIFPLHLSPSTTIHYHPLPGFGSPSSPSSPSAPIPWPLPPPRSCRRSSCAAAGAPPSSSAAAAPPRPPGWAWPEAPKRRSPTEGGRKIGVMDGGGREAD